MKLKERVLRDAYGNITIHVEGDLNFSHGHRLQESVEEILAENPYIDVNFDLTQAELVGSTGVSHFVDTLKFLKEKHTDRNIKLANVSPYFKRLFKVYDLAGDDIYKDFDLDSEMTANMNKKFGNRKFTYEN